MIGRIQTHAALTLLLAGCSSASAIDVALVDPCNQQAVGTMDYLRFEPRGEGIDSEALTTVYGVMDTGIQPIDIPLSSSFRMIVTGQRGSFSDPAAGIGVSAVRDLSNAGSAVTITVPFALVDEFYRTTDLSDPTKCSTMPIDRFGSTATYLPENGRVLIVGGARILEVGDGLFDIEYPRAVELYDPSTGLFEVKAELRVGGARYNHTATRLADGRVLISGGEARVMGVQEALRSAFIIDARDPNLVKVSDGGLAMRQARTGHTATALSDGRVVLAGGRRLTAGATGPQDHEYLDSIEIFDPDQEIFTLPTDTLGNAVPLSEPRYGHSATLLGTGFDVMVAGGMGSGGPTITLDVLRLGNGNTTVVTSSGTAVGPIFHASAVADNGSVLLAGGYNRVQDAEPGAGPPVNPSREVEMWRFNDASGALERVCSANLNNARGFHSATVSGRRAIFVGGRGTTGASLADAEVVTLAIGASCFVGVPEARAMTDARTNFGIATMGSGEILVTGGRQQNPGDLFGRSLATAEVFSPTRVP